MKAGAEIQFIAGQIFTLGVAMLAVGPRMPFDNNNSTREEEKFGTHFPSIGGDLSYPFRRALLGLVFIGMFRVVVCHIFFPNLYILDAILGTIHVIGQSFLCLTTAYLLQVQLSQVINIVPGRSLMNILIPVTILTPLGMILAHTFHHSNFNCLSHLSEALSCLGVLQTLKIYASVTGGGRPNSSGLFLVQLIRFTEYWFFTTSIISFLGEATNGYLFVKFHGDDEDHPIVVLLNAIQHNQDSGIDDWTRLLIHSIFLNSLDELQHFTATTTSSTNTNTSSSGSNNNNNRNNNASTSAAAAAEASSSFQVSSIIINEDEVMNMNHQLVISNNNSSNNNPLRSRHQHGGVTPALV